MKFNNISRRDFLKYAGLSSLVLSTQGLRWPLEAAANDPHFFLFFVLSGGADSSYLFDARPKDFAAKELQQNYSGLEPLLHEGTNGGKCWVGAGGRPLIKYKDDLAVINGVMMAPNFDGHGQNGNYLFTNNVFGGNFFLPLLNSGEPLDAFQRGEIVAPNIGNSSRIVSLEGSPAFLLNKNLKTSDDINLRSPYMDFLSLVGQGLVDSGSSLGIAGSKYLEALHSSSALDDQLRALEIKDDNSLDGFINLLFSSFKAGTIRSALVGLSTQSTIDAHALATCKDQPRILGGYMDRIGQIIGKLKSTPFDSQRSFFDVTTLMVGSEFSRTMRQKDVKFSETGTDHDSLNNSILLSGRGIRGGTVLGASDFQSVDSTLSDVHKVFDPDRLKLMAAPFDFESEKVREDLPTSYDREDYITVSHVVNTLLTAFDVPSKHHWGFTENGSPVGALKSVLMG